MASSLFWKPALAGIHPSRRPAAVNTASMPACRAERMARESFGGQHFEIWSEDLGQHLSFDQIVIIRAGAVCVHKADVARPDARLRRVLSCRAALSPTPSGLGAVR